MDIVLKGLLREKSVFQCYQSEGGICPGILSMLR